MKLPKRPHHYRDAEVIFVNHSGGKDSQAMLAKLVGMGLTDKLVIIHADLGDMEWEPMHDWIEENAFGLKVHVVKGALTFWELCLKYGKIPGGVNRICTSELKTRPCEEFMREYCENHGFTKAISALGMRRLESTGRSKIPEYEHKTQLLTKWHPIFDYSLAEVKFEIAQAGQKLHWVYGQGYSRLSCVLCPYGRIGEHKQMAKDRPETFKKMVAMEKTLGKTIRMKQRNKVKYHRYLTEYITAEA